LKIERLLADFKVPLQVTALNLPQNLNFNNNQPLTVAADKKETSLTLDARSGVAPGTYTVVFRGQAQIAPAQLGALKDKLKGRNNVTVAQPSTPFTITVLPKQVATVSLSPNNPKVKPGGKAEVTVKVSRQFDYAGEFKVELVKPPKGVSAEEVTIPAGKDEATLVVEVDPSAGGQSNLVVRATAAIKGKEVRQEAKLEVRVGK
jgi:hypothetical protein